MTEFSVAPNPSSFNQPIEASGANATQNSALPEVPPNVMTLREDSQKKKFAKKRLKPSQQLFLEKYTDPSNPAFNNGAEAYQQAYPNCKSRLAASVGAYETLRTPKVKQALAEQGWGVERLQSEMSWNIETSKTLKRLSDHREALKYMGILTGTWKEKQEITQLDEAQKDSIRRLALEDTPKNGKNT